jgi:hypothetical protein
LLHFCALFLYSACGGTPLKTAIRYALLIALPFLLLVSCGYHNPYVYNGPERTIYLTEWKNRTSELGINTKLYQTLIRWFQKAGSLHIRPDREGADLILGGEIKSIYLPSRAYAANNMAVTAQMNLTVRYILKDLRSDTVLLAEDNHVITEDYFTSSDSAFTRDNERKAIDNALNTLAQKVYQRSLVEIPRLDKKQAEDAEKKMTAPEQKATTPQQ